MKLIILILVSGLYDAKSNDAIHYQSHIIDKESMITYQVRKNETENIIKEQSIKSIEKKLKNAWSKAYN